MPKCKKSEGQAIDYAYNLLSPEEEDPFEEHLKNCPDCTEAVQSISSVLELTDKAQAELTVPELALQDIEMNVYKRLAATQEQTLLARIRAHLANPGIPISVAKDCGGEYCCYCHGNGRASIGKVIPRTRAAIA